MEQSYVEKSCVERFVSYHVVCTAFHPTGSVRDGRRDSARHGDTFQVNIGLCHFCLYIDKSCHIRIPEEYDTGYPSLFVHIIYSEYYFCAFTVTTSRYARRLHVRHG